jgi:hypothetical protein
VLVRYAFGGGSDGDCLNLPVFADARAVGRAIAIVQDEPGAIPAEDVTGQHVGVE